MPTVLERVRVDDDRISRYFTGVERKLGWLSQRDFAQNAYCREVRNTVCSTTTKDAPKIDYIDGSLPDVDAGYRTRRYLPKEKTAVPPTRAWHAYMSMPEKRRFFAETSSTYLTIRSPVSVSTWAAYRLDARLLAVRRQESVPAGWSGRLLRDMSFVGSKLYAEIADPERTIRMRRAEKKEAPSGDGAPRAGKAGAETGWEL